MFSWIYRKDAVTRINLIIVVLVNAVVPTTALANPSNMGDESVATELIPPSSTPPLQAKIYHTPEEEPSNTLNFSPDRKDEIPPVPEKDVVEFSIFAANGELATDRVLSLNVKFRNTAEFAVTDLSYLDNLQDLGDYISSGEKQVEYNHTTKTVSLSINILQPGEEFSFSYDVKVKGANPNTVTIHNSDIEYTYVGTTRSASTSLGFTESSTLVGADTQILVPDQAGDGWNSSGRISLYLNKEVLPQDAVVVIKLEKRSGKGPELQFNLDLLQTAPKKKDGNGRLNEQKAELVEVIEPQFETPAYLEINLDGVIDLRTLPADQEPYVATYDEEHNVWVKVPIIMENVETNSVTVEAAHFSTWGAGLGNALPKNGANVLLFDQPYTSLFTGAARYSIPIWTPQGRAGMQPNISLSYSSATVDGILGDVQAPWTGVGWNIDGIEIVRKITTNENGYGYANDFALTLNGAVYKLVQDNLQPNRYYTDHDAFLYIERHNYAYGNAQNHDGSYPQNSTGEWWEVVTTDGTRYRMGWNTDSEQLALMYGYKCTTNGSNCLTPDGAYASLGYAGRANDLVALRWRVDRIQDTHGNYITYTYTESHPAGGGTVAEFDRESYLEIIAYTGYENSDFPDKAKSPSYFVHFVYADRPGDAPTTYFLWDNVDSKLLDRIVVCYTACSGPNIVRSYDFGYSVATVPNADGTLTLTSMEVIGTNGVTTTQAPTVRFTYENKANRAVSGSNDVYTYPRLSKIDNGAGGVLTYTYETDGRDANSWYNYRVKQVKVENGLGTAALQSYAYTDPFYSGSGGNPNYGELIGYKTTTESQLDYTNSDAVILSTAHFFGTSGLDMGRELRTELSKGATIYRRTTNIYVTDNSKAPFDKWNFRYLYSSLNYELSGGNMVLATKSIFKRDPATGNLLSQVQYLGSSVYRKTYYEYLVNPDPTVYILDTASRALVVDASNAILSDIRYHYDDQINMAPSRGDLTLVQRLTGAGSQTVDQRIHYNEYGNVDSAKLYSDYGTAGVEPLGTAFETSTVYDAAMETLPIRSMNPLSQETLTDYLPALGLPYRVTDPNGWETITEYDGLGRTLSVWAPGLNQPGVYYSYPDVNPATGRIEAPYSVEMQILDMAAAPIQYRSVWGIYDGLGRMLQTQVYDADTQKLLVTDSYFNAQGLAYQQSLPYEITANGGYYSPPSGNQFNATTFDPLGRPLTVTQPGNIVTTTSYDGFATTILDPNGNKTVRTTDGLGRLITVQEYADAGSLYATTTYTYDPADRLVRVVDANGNETLLQYDWFGRKLWMNDPDMGAWEYAYYPAGNLQWQKDARGVEITFNYDALGRLTSKTGTDLNATYQYGTTPGTIGLRIGMTDGTGTTTWNYSNFGRVVTENRQINGNTSSMTTTTDWLGRPIFVSYPDGEALTYKYDALGRPDQLTSDQNATLVDLAYNTLGQITSQTLGNGVAVTNTYNASTNRLESRTAPQVLNFSYSYDNTGNITHITDDILNETHDYSYDFLNRLTLAEAYTTGSPAIYKYRQQFTYDSVGNMTGMNDWTTGSQSHLDTQSPGMDVLASYKYPSFGGQFLQEPSTDTPTPTATETATDTPTSTPTNTNTPLMTPVATNTKNSTPTNSVTPTFTISPTPNSHPTWTNTPTITITPTATLLPEQNLKAYWNFDGASGSTVPDVAPDDAMDNTANLVNGAVIQTNGVSGYSVFFDGSNDYASIPNHAEIRNNGSFTVSAWVNPASVVTSRTQYIVQKGGINNKDYGLITYSTQGTPTPTGTTNVYANGNIAFQIGDLVPNLLTGPILPVNTWSHVVGVYDSAAQETRMYINGDLVASQEVTGTLSMSSAALTFSSNNLSYVYHGGLDEVRFYNRPLVPEEVSDLYTMFAPPTPLPSSTPTFTPTPDYTATPLPMSQQQWGDGMDGDLIVNSGTEFNLNTDKSNGRSCADAIAYNVTLLGNTAAALESASGSGCLVSGDEILIIQLTDSSANSYNAGSYEFLRVDSVVDNVINFTSPKNYWYGNGWRSDAGIGTGTGQYRVMLIRVPNYNNVTIDGVLKINSYNNRKYGVLAFRVNGVLNGAGSITVNGAGYPNQTGYGAGSPGSGVNYNQTGGGGGYGTAGQQVWASGGPAYGIPNLSRLFFGSGGGSAGDNPGGRGGGIVLISGQSINFSGSITSIGANGVNSYGYPSGAGAGGSVRIEGSTITLGTVSAQGGGAYAAGGAGRIAVYYQTNSAITTANPAPYTRIIGQLPTPTPTSTPIDYIVPVPMLTWGNGSDGPLTINSGQTFNLSTTKANGVVCPDGGDAVSYSVVELSESSAKLTKVPGQNCLKPGDEVLLIHLSGSGPNIGKYEFLKVGGIQDTFVYFTEAKSFWYGSGIFDDLNIGVSAGQQRIMLVRVPNYSTVINNGTLKVNAFDKYKGGVLVFRVADTLSGSGIIHANALGFTGETGYGAGRTGGSSTNQPGSGGGHGTAGATTTWATGGSTYGSPELFKLYFGSGGGHLGGYQISETEWVSGGGGTGGGIVLVAVRTINYSGVISAQGGNGTNSANHLAGAGAGGSIRIEGDTISLPGAVNVQGGPYYAAGGLGRVAVYYQTSFAGNFTPDYIQHVPPEAVFTPPPTSTPIPVYIDTYTVSLLHMDGMDAETQFIDETGKTWSKNGDAQVDTDQFKFGGASALFDGTGDYIHTIDSDDWRLDGGSNSNAWTIDGWVKLPSDPGDTYRYGIAQQYVDGNNFWALSLYNNTLQFVVKSGGTDIVNIQNAFNPSANTWYHLAVVKDGTAGYKMFVNGYQIGSTQIDTSGVPNFAGPLRIGQYQLASTLKGFNGWIDEIHIGKGAARWTSNFVPPTAPYQTNSISTPTPSITPTPLPTSGWTIREFAYDASHPHAVASVSENSTPAASYIYDANGNMTCRMESGVTYLHAYNTENRISSITKLASGDCSTPGNSATKWDFGYDGDGVRVGTLTTTYDESGAPSGSSWTAYYFGGAYEVRSDNTTIKYYSFAGQMVAMNECTPQGCGTGLQYFLTDHLGSVVAVTDASGTLIAQQRYLPFGGERTNVPSPNAPSTDYGYTGQRDLDPGMGGLMDYKARFYSPYLNHFIQPDTIIPDPSNPQMWNRYSYVVNNPILYTDSTGHCIDGVSTWVCVGIVLTVGALVLTGDTQESAKHIENSNATSIDLTEAVDNIIWENIPSAIGVKLSAGGQAGFIAEGGGSGGIGVAFNWRSKQLSIIADASAQGYIGTPQVISNGGSFSAFYVYGASRNENLAGISDYTGVTFMIDRILQGGATITQSTGLTPDGDIYIDRNSNKPIITKQISLNFGGNLVANGADIGFVFGRSYTQIDESLSWTIKNNKWRPE